MPRLLASWRDSLVTNFMFGTTVALLLTAGAMASRWHVGRTSDAQAAIFSLQQTAQAVAAITDDLFDEGVTLAGALAADEDVQSLDPARFGPFLGRQAKLHPQFNDFIVIDKDGRVVAQTSPDGPFVRDVRERGFFQRVVATRTATAIREADPSQDAGLSTGIAVPIRADDDSFVGLLALTFDAERFDARLSQIRLSPGQALAILDPNGRLATVVGDVPFRISNLTWEDRNRAGIPEVQRAMQGETVTAAAWRGSLARTDRLAAFIPTPRHGWLVAATWATDDALAASRVEGGQDIILFALIGIVVLISVWMMARSIVFPLRYLTAQVERLGASAGESEFAPIMTFSRANEIGRLADAFNRMAQRLQQSIGELRAEQDRVEAVFEQLPVGVLVVSAADNAFVRVNALGAQVLRMIDMDLGHYTPADGLMLVSPDGRQYQPDERPLARALATGEAIVREEVVLRRPGQPDTWVWLNAAPIRDRTGEIVAAVETVEDVTVRHLEERRQREQDAALRELFQQFPGGFGVVDRDDRIVMAFLPDENRTDLPRETRIEGRTLAEVFPPDRAAELKAQFARALAGETFTIEETTDAGVFNMVFSPIREADGMISRALVLRVDVTELRRTAAQLRERDQLLHTLVEQFPSTISVVDRRYRVMMVGGQRSLASDLPKPEIVGLPLAEVLPPGAFASYREQAERSFAGETLTVDARRGDHTVRITTVPLRNEAGAIDSVLNVVADVTEEVARVERSSRDEKLRALGQMAGGIAHDLNQALTLVAGYGELVREALSHDGAGIAPACDMVRIMERAAYDGGETVKRLLTFARGGGEDELRQPINVAGLLNEVERLTAPRWRDSAQVTDSRITLAVEAAPDLTVYGSQSALREALTNLVFNAIDAMPDGGSIGLSARGRDGAVVIDVSDSGMGMTPEVRERLFEPFFTTKGNAGTGLGLAMVFGIVERHQGQIDVSSHVGLGTTISLTLPVLEASPSATTDPVTTTVAAACRVLVVDDELKLATLLVGMLRREGHETVTATSAEMALEVLRDQQVDLVISDLSMGDGMNGWDLAAAIVASSCPVPVILATGWGAGIEADEARARGVSAVVAKPYRRADIRAALASVLASSAGG